MVCSPQGAELKVDASYRRPRSYLPPDDGAGGNEGDDGAGDDVGAVGAVGVATLASPIS